MFERLCKLLGFKSRQEGAAAALAAGLDAREFAPPPAAAGDPNEHYRKGLALLEAGQLNAAEEAFQNALAAQHDHADAHFSLGRLYEGQARSEDAADSYLLAVCFRPDFAGALFRLGALAAREKKWDDAIDYFRRTIAVEPRHAAAHNYLGNMFLEQRKPLEAEGCYRAAIAANPEFAAGHCNLGYILHWEHSLLDEALACIDRALALDPHLIEARYNRVRVFQSLGRSEEALAECARVLQQNPAHKKTLVNRSLAYLLLGEFERGWREYEIRREVYECFRYRSFPQPEWNGESLDGRTVLVYAEQGLGDEIMFSSCIPELLGRAAHCVIDCHPKLERLFRRSFRGASVHGGSQTDGDLSWMQGMPHVDVQVPAGTLPLHFRKRVEDFPRRAGFLVADPERVAYWKERLAGLGSGLKVGISWRGGVNITHRAIRSLELKQLAPLVSVPGAQFVSLQYTDCVQELEDLRRELGLEVHHWQEAIDDYDETAALVCALDLVVTVQTAVLHLAGALGRPAWVMVPAAPEWRYQRSGEGMPWYPTVRIARQHELGDWQPVIERVALDVGRLAAEHRC